MIGFMGTQFLSHELAAYVWGGTSVIGSLAADPTAINNPAPTNAADRPSRIVIPPERLEFSHPA